MEKVKLPREVVEAIEHMRSSDNDNEDIIGYAMGNANGPLPTTLRKFTKEQGFDSLLIALVNGYEVEETPEERIKEVYTKQAPILRPGHPGYYKQLEVCNAFQEGVVFTLNTINIKIEGVNA